MKPLCIDLFCGLGGWAEGFLAEGWRVIGFDVERHDYGTGGYPGRLRLRDVTKLHGSEFKEAAVIVASPPCQKYSYMTMPWKRAKALAAWYAGSSERIAELNRLFDTCFRIQREASEAAGRYIPLIVENVRGAQRWVGKARWHFGSYFLWGDVPALMPIAFRAAAEKVHEHLNIRDDHSHTHHLTKQAEHTKNDGGSWFAVAHNTSSGHGKNPVNSPDARSSDAVKVGGIDFNGPKAVGFNVTAAQRYRQERKANGDWFNATYAERKASGKGHANMFASGSNSRKAASAQIAKIPFPLAQHIARVFKVSPSSDSLPSQDGAVRAEGVSGRPCADGKGKVDVSPQV